jgi:autotransporter-associated beta strand protein
MNPLFRHRRIRQRLAAVVLFATAAPFARGQTQITWTGATNTNWNNTGNWTPSTIPNSSSHLANFTGNALGTVNVASNVSLGGLTFNNPSGNYTITSGAGVTVSMTSFAAITVAAGVTGIQTINLSNVATGSLLTGNNFAIVNNSTAAGNTLVIGSNTVLAPAGFIETSVQVSGAGNTLISGSFGSGVIQVDGMANHGPGTLTFSGNGTNLGGGLSLLGGTFVLDYSSNTAQKLGTGSLTLGGGVLSLTANSATTVTQTISGGTTVAAGHTDVRATGTGAISLDAGAITRQVGATADFTLSLSGTIATTDTPTGTARGLLGAGPAYATLNAGTTWASKTAAFGNSVVGLNTYGTNTFTTDTNVDVTISSSQSSFTANSLRLFGGGLTLSLAGTNTLQSGGILSTGGTSANTITGGSLTAPGADELLVHVYNSAGLTVNSSLVSTFGLTKTGPSALTLGGANAGLTGPINVNRGSLTVTNLAAVNSASGINFNDPRPGAGLQVFTIDLGDNTSGTITHPIRVTAFSATGGGTTFSTGSSLNSRITLPVINDSSRFASVRFTGDASNSSGFNLSPNSGSFAGPMTLSHGTLAIAPGGSLSNPLTLEVGDVASGGFEFPGTVPADSVILGPVTINATTRVVCNNPASNRINATISSTGSGAGFQLVKTGAGILLFQRDNSGFTGQLTLNGGTLDLRYDSSQTPKYNGALNLGGGVLTLNSEISSGLTQLTPGNTTVFAGHTDVQMVNNGAALALAAGAIGHTIGGTVDFAGLGGGNSATSTSGSVNSLLGAGPAFGTVGGGATWASVSGVTITGLSNYGTNTFGSGVNTDVTVTASPSSFITNSLRFSTGNLTITLTGANTVQSGGILVTPTSTGGTIAGGSLVATSSGELLVHQYSASGFTINSALTSTSGLTKTGPGTLILGGSNTGLTGPINVNRGHLMATALAAVNSASVISFNDNHTFGAAGGLQQFTLEFGNNFSGALAVPIRLTATSLTDYGTYFSTGASTGSQVTLGGGLSSAPGTNTSIRFTGNVGNTSGFNLTNANTWAGNVSLQHGSLGIASDASLGNAANVLTLEVNDSNNGGLVFLNGGVTVARPVVIATPTRLVSNANDSNAISGLMSGAGGVTKAGTGSLTLTNSANSVTGGVTVAAGTLLLGTNGGLPVATNVTVNTGGTFGPASLVAGAFGTISLNGGTFRMSSATPVTDTVNQIATNPAGGTIDLSGTVHSAITVATGISVFGNSTWLSPANTSTITSQSAADVPINILPGVTLNNGIALAIVNQFGFRVIGGGTLFQNSDAANTLAITAPVTVAQGSTYRVTDIARNGGVGNLGTGRFSLDGGTLNYAGTSASTLANVFLTNAGGTMQVELAPTTLTFDGAILGSAGMTKTGPGTLLLTNGANSFSGLTVTAGTLQTATDNTLGAGPIAIGPFGTLAYSGTTSTSRTITSNSGTLSVGAGAVLTLNGALVGGGFLAGPGIFAATSGTSLAGVSTVGNAGVNVTGSANFVNFGNGGPLTISFGLAASTTFTRFTNQGSGSITVGAASPLNIAEFQSYGTLTVNPATITPDFSQTTLITNVGTSSLSFNGGSRTFVGTPTTAVFPSNWPDVSQRGLPTFVAGIDLNGKNAIVAGGLFVNNGYMVDSTNGGTGTATVVADFGALVKGAGFFQNSVQTINGGKFQAGNSPGAATFGKFVLGPGGVNNYVFAINDATGTAGPQPDTEGRVSGWSLVDVIAPKLLHGGPERAGDFTWTATPADKLTVSLQTLLNPTTVGDDVPGPMDQFDCTHSYVWRAVEWSGTYSGPADVAELDASTTFDSTGFANAITGSFGWSLDTTDHSLSLTYTPSAVPEPGTVLLTVGPAIGFGCVFRQIRGFKLNRPG